MNGETGPDANASGSPAQPGHQDQAGDGSAREGSAREGSVRDGPAGSGSDRDRPAQDGPAGGGRAPGHRPPTTGLAADPRVPVWITRAIAAAVAGFAIAIWLNWRLGVTAAALVAIADTIYRSKTTAFVPAAARVSSAQRRTRRRLAMLRMNGYVTLNARPIPGSDQVIDHLVIGPAGVLAVDSERWDRRLPVRLAVGGQIYHGPFSQRHRLEHARWEAAQAARLLSDATKQAIDVRPVMVIYGPKIPWNVIGLLGVDVFSGSQLRKYLRRQVRARRPKRLDEQQIRVIQEAAEQVLPPA